MIEAVKLLCSMSCINSKLNIQNSKFLDPWPLEPFGVYCIEFSQ
jgi:hypothetical protein